jgi:DNA modification methylase
MKRADEEKPREKRRALTHVGGAITTAGDAEDAAKLARALDVPASTEPGGSGGGARAPLGVEHEDPSRLHVHGFHAYPARMHPITAARLVEAFGTNRGAVLDPFCGSGTVLVEAMIAKRRALGTDLNLVAVRLARCKTRPREAEELAALVERARGCAAFADERRKAKAGATRRFPHDDVRLFEPHVLLELDSLRAAIKTVEDPRAREDLSLVLSALLVKLSRKRGDTSDLIDKRRTAAGYTAKLFVKKAEDLARRLAAFRGLLGNPAPYPAFVELDDATVLRTLPREPVAAIVTSPPYAATYDYLAHHALRMRWLELDASPLMHGELGARRTYAKLDPRDAREEWSRELARFFVAAARVLPKGAPMVLVMADSAVRSVALRADDVVAETARECGFVPAARASQARPHFHGPTQAAFRDRPREEHALLLRRA